MRRAEHRYQMKSCALRLAFMQLRHEYNHVHMCLTNLMLVSSVTYLVAAPIKDLICLSIVCDRVTITDSDTVDGHVESAVNTQRRVFSSVSTKRAIVVATPGKKHTIARKCDSMHAAARNLNNRLEQRNARAEFHLRLACLLHLGRGIIAKTYKKAANQSYVSNGINKFSAKLQLATID